MALYGTVVGRWYVTVLGAVFGWRAVRHLGWRRTGVYVVVALVAGGLAENGSVHFGFPYTRYAFNPALRGKELFLGDVPIIVPLSYTFMGYFAFATGRLIASGPWRTRARRVSHELVPGIILAVWALWIFDPVARLGHRWFLGELFHYAGPGFWFGLPLGSQVGFGATALVLVGCLTWLAREDPAESVVRWQDHPHLVALLTYHGQIVWLATVACVLGATELGGSAALIWVPAATITWMRWSDLRPPGPLPGHPVEPAVAARAH